MIENGLRGLDGLHTALHWTMHLREWIYTHAACSKIYSQVNDAFIGEKLATDSTRFSGKALQRS